MEGFTDLVDICFVGNFVAGDSIYFGVKGIKVIFGTVVTGVAAIVKQLFVKHEAGFEGFGKKVVFHVVSFEPYELSIAVFR